jgi:hypothetical protein
MNAKSAMKKALAFLIAVFPVAPSIIADHRRDPVSLPELARPAIPDQLAARPAHEPAEFAANHESVRFHSEWTEYVRP